MIPFPAETVAEFTRRGYWGSTTVDDLFRTAVIGARDRLAIVDPPDKLATTDIEPLRLTWLQLDERVDRLCARLMAVGLIKDDVVAVQLPNGVELALVYLAAARLGLILSPFPIQYREHELHDLLDFSGAKVFITLGRFKNHDHEAMALGLLARTPTLQRIMTWRSRAHRAGQPASGACPLEDLMDGPLDRAAVACRHREAAVDANEIFTITWTSGTEARPKGVPKTHNHWVISGIACAQAGELGEGDVLLNPFPMTHVGSLGGMFFPWLIKRGVLVQHQPFDLETFLRQIAEERVRYTVAPPAVLNLLVQNETLRQRYDLSSLRSVGSGSAPLSPWMIQGLQDLYGISVWNSFGSSEGCALFGSAHDVPDPQARAEYLPRFGVEGLAWPSWVAGIQETRLVDPETGEVITTPGRPGELRLRGPIVFSGYWREPELTRRAFDSEGFFRSGDTFELTGDGPTPRYYHYLARSKDLINRGGMKISPVEIESLLDGHPLIREAAVIGTPDARLGEIVCAVVALREPEAVITLPDVVSYLKGRQIAVYKLPERLEVVPALPRSPVGKVLKREIRDGLSSGSGERARHNIPR
ncbi:MAG: acyl--CoA ligase [Rhodoferax sp.]|nr:acyl--CoA ligase [Rhodoferax sp.]